MKEDESKIGLFSLIGIIISAIVGAGIFNLTKEMANTASAGIAMIGWLIAGIGTGSLALCMVNLNTKRPDLEAGIFSYAQEGFGDYVGFNSIWGYWVSVNIGNVAFGTLLFSALSYFFPIFGNGQNVAAIIGASIVLWIIHFVVLRGLNQAALINTVVMIAKLVPILIFLVCIIFAFNKDIFVAEFWGQLSAKGSGSSIFEQLKGTVLVTVWVFIGLEGAVVFSGRAHKRSDVGKATLLGFAAVTLIYAATTVFSYGILSQEQLQNLPNPAMAYILEAVIGKTGAVIVNLGVIISILGAWIANTLLAEEVSYRAGVRGLYPKFFTKENKYKMPVNSMITANLFVQLLLLSFLVTDEAYSLLSKLSSATILLPYSCVALFQLKVTIKDKEEKIFSRNMLVGVIAVIYMLWLITSSGMMYVLLTMMIVFPGTLMYIYTKKKGGAKVFHSYEYLIVAVIFILFVMGLLRIPQLLS